MLGLCFCLLVLCSRVAGTIPSGEISTAISGRTFVNIKCSENVNVFLQPSYNATQVPARTNCPWNSPGLTNFENKYGRLSANANATVATGDLVLFTPNSLPVNPTDIVYRITVKSGGTLIFGEFNFTLHIREIYVEQGGNLWIGNVTCRVNANINIIFRGIKAASSLSGFSSTGPASKGLITAGTANIHGKQYIPTWTRLALSARSGDSIIFLGQNVNWEIGQQVLITTSAYYDCPPQFQAAFCSNNTHQNEVRTIVDTYLNCSAGVFALKLNAGLNYLHFAGKEYQTEVALLSRKIKLSAFDTTGGFGGHTMAIGNGVVRFTGVQADQMGQLNVLARYPFHLHMLGEKGNNSYFYDCLVTHSFFRAFTIHGTNNTKVSKNVAYNITGFAFYLEDGVEENNAFDFNFAAHISPIYRPADGIGQDGETFTENSSLIVPADTSASGFYISNAYNRFVGNAASGGWSGFAFPNLPFPVGAYKSLDNGNNNPLKRPILQFSGNTAHSTGFYWTSHGSAVYCGAWLNYQNGVLTYKSGRNSRDTVYSNGTATIMYFYHTKVWATTKGLAHWGNSPEIYFYEAHDIMNSAMLFGSGTISNAIINARTANTIAWQTWSTASRTKYITGRKMGFQFYDTWTSAILTRITFRNWNGADEYAIRSTDHSDQFLPQGINALRAIKYENMNKSSIVKIKNCGPDCGTNETLASMSSRIYSFWDFDGTFTMSGTPSILGSGRNWWNVGDKCTYETEWKLWRCRWTNNTHIAHLPVYVPGLTDGCDLTVGGCNGQKAYYTVGRISQFGSLNNAIDLSPWPGITGIANIGWYWRPKATPIGIDGAPSKFIINDYYQIPRKTFVVLAVRYPASTQFTVTLEYQYQTPVAHWVLPMSTKAQVLFPFENLVDESAITGCNITSYNPDQSVGPSWVKLCSGTGAIGPSWHFDGNHLFLRVVQAGCYTSVGKYKCQYSATYTRDGATVFKMMGGYKYIITASCTGCAIQKSYKGIDYFSVSDYAPAAFAAQPGSDRPYPPITYTSIQTCSAGNPQGCV